MILCSLGGSIHFRLRPKQGANVILLFKGISSGGKEVFMGRMHFMAKMFS